MSLTNGRDIYIGVHENGLNKIIQYIMRLRPKQFNYGSPYFVEDPKRCCVQLSKGSLSPEDALPLPGTNDLAAAEFAIQIVDVRIDVYPSTLPLPPGVTLPSQRFSLSTTVVLSIAFPKIPEDWRPPVGQPGPKPTFSYEKVICCRLSAFAVCGISRVRGIPPGETAEAELLAPTIDLLEIVDIGPNELETIFEKIALLNIRHGILNRTLIKLERAAGDLFKVVLSSISPNPSLDNDQVKLWGDVIILN